jgi:two-component system response regulator ArlR
MRILLVEDDRSLSRAVSTILQKNNYSVDCVENGQIALDYLEELQSPH